jgi:hypothetical protein
MMKNSVEIDTLVILLMFLSNKKFVKYDYLVETI